MSSSGVLCTIMTPLVIDFEKINSKNFFSLNAAYLLDFKHLYRGQYVTFFTESLSFLKMLC